MSVEKEEKSKKTSEKLDEGAAGEKQGQKGKYGKVQKMLTFLGASLTCHMSCVYWSLILHLTWLSEIINSWLKIWFNHG